MNVNDFLQSQGYAIITAVIMLILGILLRPFLEATARKLSTWLGGLTSDFQKRYYDHLREEYRVMNIRGRKTRSPSPELEQVYVSLRTQRPEAIEASRPGQSESLSVEQAMARSRRLVIIGGPGSGKTTLLTYLLLTCVRRLVRDRLKLREKLFPIFVPLRRLKVVLDQPERCSLPAYLTD